MGELTAIFLKRAHRGPMDPVPTVRCDAGAGLADNADRGGKRQVTLLSAERWRDAEAELGAEVDPRSRRANLLTTGIDYLDSRGRVLRIGAVRIAIRGNTRPCERMDEAFPGLRKALEPDWRAGAYGELLDDGEISLGDSVAWLEEPAP